MASVIRSLRLLPLSRAIVPRAQPLALFRPFSASSLRKAGHEEHGHNDAPPQLYGPGGKAGEVPSDEQQATGLERFELMGDLLGVDVFDMKPLEVNRMGTMDDPIEVFTLYPERQVGCTGFPADSHDTLWMNITHKHKRARCHECGCVYTLNYKGDPALIEQYEAERSGHGHATH